MKMNKVLFNIIHLVAAAQAHSDEGKINKSLYGETVKVLNFTGKTCDGGYPGKDDAILAAIKIIDTHKYMGVNYYVKDNGKNVIVYFNFKIDGKRYQVSFHSFSNKLRKLIGKGSSCRWEKKMSCRETCQTLLKLCGKESEIYVY